jgi:hypothetical protein
MSTPDDELEAAIWAAMRIHQVTCPTPGAFLDDLKYAAMRYAAGDSDALTAMRREILHRDTWPEGQTSPSTSGTGTGTAPELDPPGSGAFPQGAGDGGATPSTGTSIPGPVTRRDASLSTGVDEVIHRGGQA